MGSGNKRRKRDVASPGIIDRTSLNGEIVKNVKSHDLKCPVSPKLKLSSNKLIDGQEIKLIVKNETLSILAGISKIQEVENKDKEILIHCLKKGFIYTGIYKNGYGYFRRSTSS